jgi:hypothetical protein
MIIFCDKCEISFIGDHPTDRCPLCELKGALHEILEEFVNKPPQERKHCRNCSLVKKEAS